MDSIRFDCLLGRPIHESPHQAVRISYAASRAELSTALTRLEAWLARTTPADEDWRYAVSDWMSSEDGMSLF